MSWLVIPPAWTGRKYFLIDLKQQTHLITLQSYILDELIGVLADWFWSIPSELARCHTFWFKSNFYTCWITSGSIHSKWFCGIPPGWFKNFYGLDEFKKRTPWWNSKNLLPSVTWKPTFSMNLKIVLSQWSRKHTFWMTPSSIPSE